MNLRKRHRRLSCSIAFLMCVSINFSLCIPAGADSKSRVAEQENIWEAVFRYQFKQHSGVLCLSIPGKNNDPSDAFMSRFKDSAGQKILTISTGQEPQVSTMVLGSKNWPANDRSVRRQNHMDK